MILLIAYILNIIDYLFTARLVNLYGVEIEGNPFGRWILETNQAFGVKFVLVPILLAVMGICIHINPKLKWTGYIPFAVYLGITIYHLFIMLYECRIR